MRLREIRLSISRRTSEMGRRLVRFVRCDMMISTCAPAMELCAGADTLSRCIQHGAKVKRER